MSEKLKRAYKENPLTKISRETSERIAELKARIKEIEAGTVQKETYDQLHIDYVNRGIRIAELEKENADLQDELKSTEAGYKALQSMHEQTKKDYADNLAVKDKRIAELEEENAELKK